MKGRSREEREVLREGKKARRRKERRKDGGMEEDKPWDVDGEWEKESKISVFHQKCRLQSWKT